LAIHDDEKQLAELGVSEGDLIHCLTSWKVDTEKVDTDQQLSCFPHSCSVDGGRVVHVLGERFPASTRTVCRFGRLFVEARIEDEGVESGVSQLVCTAPAHPAGPVTVSVSFDGGATWLEGPTFWYLDPSSGACTRGIAVPAGCRGLEETVRCDITSGVRWGGDGGDGGGPGSGCV
ncbi:unnamed protein product, partial [Polarella glacialis]